jgi:hypothetical protein
MTQLSLFGGQNHFGLSKDFATKTIPKLFCRNWRPHKLCETMQNKQAWYFVGQNSYFSGNPQNQALGIGGKPLMCMGRVCQVGFCNVLTYNGEVMNIEKIHSLKILF